MLNTKSSFIYGHIINDDIYNLDFNEGAGVLTAKLNLGSYSITDFAVEVERALNTEGANDYTVILNRSTRKISISSSLSFDLLAFTGPTIGTSVFPLLGFTSTDKTGLTSYEGENTSGEEYKPQYFLQGYVDFEDYQEASSSSISQSAEGIVQVSKFGILKYMECQISYIRDSESCQGSFLDPDPEAVSNARKFMENIVQKTEIEFIPNREDPNIFTKCLLESTTLSGQGTGFRLYEMSSKQLYNYYETKKLKFRKVN